MSELYLLADKIFLYLVFGLSLLVTLFGVFLTAMLGYELFR